MNHFIVDRCAESIGKASISLESRSRSVIADKRFGNFIEIKSGNPGSIIAATSASVLDTSILLSFNNPTSSSVFKYNIKERYTNYIDVTDPTLPLTRPDFIRPS